MKSYQIAELEQLTGIKAHTIRIWEKRYNLIEPDRTSTNIRKYNDEQVRKLLNVSTLLSNGYKISKIADLNDEEIASKITELQTEGEANSICASFINDLIASMLGFNEQAFEKTYSAAVTRFGIYEAMLNVFYPLFQKIGVLWVINNITPVQEHFASCIIKRKLMSATDGLPMPTKKKKFLLLLPPGEYHDISLLFANYIIRSKGYETIYLGQNVPYENVSLVLKETKPQFILMFFINPQNSEGVYEEIMLNLQLPKDIKLLVSGNPIIVDHLQNRKNIDLLRSPTDLIELL